MLYEIIRYFNLEQEIKALQQELKHRRKLFYSCTMTTRTEVMHMQFMVVSFDICKEVTSLIERTQAIEKRIDNLKLKKKYLDKFLNSLSIDEREYLINRYRYSDFSQDHVIADEKLMNEIEEIETAINYHNGIGEIEDIRETIEEMKSDETSTPMDHINKVLEVLEP